MLLPDPKSVSRAKSAPRHRIGRKADAAIVREADPCSFEGGAYRSLVVVVRLPGASLEISDGSVREASSGRKLLARPFQTGSRRAALRPC